MENETWRYPFATYEDRLQHFWDAVVERGIKAPPEYAMALLINSVERLKVSTDENLKGIERLKASTEESSNQANRLSSAIKNLTGWLVGLTVAAVILAGLSLWALLHAPR